MFTCEICNYSTDYISNYNRHMKTNMHLDPINYCCHSCGFSTKDKSKYDRHINSASHYQITREIPVQDMSMKELLMKYKRSSVRYGLYNQGIRRLSKASKSMVHNHKLMDISEYPTLYMEFESRMKEECPYLYTNKYERYAYPKNKLSPALLYPL